MTNIDLAVLALLATGTPCITQAAEYQIRIDDIDLSGNVTWKAWLRNKFAGKMYVVDSQEKARMIYDARADFISAGIEEENSWKDRSGTSEERYQRFLRIHKLMQDRLNELERLLSAHARRIQ